MMSFVQKKTKKQQQQQKKQKGKRKAGVKAKYSQFLFLRHIFVWHPSAFLHIWLSGNQSATAITLLHRLYHNCTFLTANKSCLHSLLIIFPARNAHGAKIEDGRMRDARASSIRQDTTHQQKKIVFHSYLLIQLIELALSVSLLFL